MIALERKQRATATEDAKAKMKEDDRSRKRRCLRGEHSGDR